MRNDLWTQDDIDLLMRDFPGKRTKDVAEALGRTIRAVNVMAHKLGLKKDHYGIVLTDKQKDYLVRHFKDTDNEYLAIMLGISQTTLHRYARRWGLRKSKAHVKRMQMECAMAAKASHLAHGTYPPKGYRIPGGEAHRFKPGETRAQRIGEKANRECIRRAAETRKKTIMDERIRYMRGLPQRTRLKVSREPRQRTSDRCYLKKRGYILDEANSVAYWTSSTRRATKLEARPKRYYEFKPYINDDNE